MKLKWCSPWGHAVHGSSVLAVCSGAIDSTRMLREGMDPVFFIAIDETPSPILVHIHPNGELCKVSGVKFVIAGVGKGFVLARVRESQGSLGLCFVMVKKDAHIAGVGPGKFG